MNGPGTLRGRITARIEAGPSRAVWTANDFADLAARDAVDKALQRLVNTGVMTRLDRGLYYRQMLNTLTGRGNPPDSAAVIDAVARRDRIRVLVDGLTAANDLGFTNAVPAKITVHVDARLRPIRLGELEIRFRPTAASKLFWASRPAMRLVQALHWVRDLLQDPAEAERIRERVRRLLKDEAVRNDLASGFSALPGWMQALVRPVLEAQISGDAA